MCVRERERQKYVPVGTSGSVVTHGEVSVPPRGPRQLWPLLPHNRVGEHQRQLLLLLWISTQAQEDKEGLEQNPVSKYVLYNIEPRSCPCMCFWNRQRADFRVFLLNRAMVKWRFPVPLNAEGYPSQIWAERPFNPVTTGANVLNARFTARGAFT